jgi:hypothetical protein
MLPSHVFLVFQVDVLEEVSPPKWCLLWGWTIGVLGFDSRRGLGIFIFTIASRTALGPTQPPIQWVPGALSLGVKRLGREADHSSPCSADFKNAWSYTSTLQYVFMVWCLVKHRDNFTFTFLMRFTSEINEHQDLCELLKKFKKKNICCTPVWSTANIFKPPRHTRTVRRQQVNI